MIQSKRRIVQRYPWKMLAIERRSDQLNNKKKML